MSNIFNLCNVDFLAAPPSPNNVVVRSTDSTFSPAQGELDYSIYRTADARDTNITFSGLNLGDVSSSQKFIDSLNIPDAIFTDTIPATVNITDFYTDSITPASFFSQTVFNSPNSFRCVKNQYEARLCPKATVDPERVVPYQRLRSFLLTTQQPAKFHDLSPTERQAFVRNVQERFLETEEPVSSPYAFMVGFTYILPGITPERFDSDFFKLVATPEVLDRYYKCAYYYRTGQIVEDELVKIDPSLCANNGKPITYSVFPENPEERTDLGSFLPSSETKFFSYKDSVSGVSKRRDVIRREDALSTFEPNDNHGLEDPSILRVDNSVRVSELQVDEYNAEYFDFNWIS